MGSVLDEKIHLERRAAGKREADQRKRGRPSVSVKIGGKQYRILSDADPESLQRVAGYVDDAMSLIRDKTETVDSHDVAVLTALNLAREVLRLKGAAEADLPGGERVGNSRLRDLIELAEAELADSDSSSAAS